MKSVKYLTIIAIAGMALGSCKKSFLTLYPQGNLNTGNFYKTTSDFQQALVATYEPLRDAANVAFYLEEMRADNTYFDYNTKDRGSQSTEEISYFLDDANDPEISTIWTADYNGIQRANVILDQITGATAVPDSAKNAIRGEAEALRAHYYFELVRLFGGVPLYLHQTTTNANAFVARSSVDSVYSQIVSDLTDALGKVALPASFPGTGRVTKGMIATELGAVYLTQKQWSQASTILQTVTTMGYGLLANYGDVFTTANENSKEAIFEIQYKSGTDGQSSAFIYRFIPATPQTLNILGVQYNNNTNNYGGWNVPTQNVIGTYEPGDRRLDASVAVTKGKLDGAQYFEPDSVVSVLSPATPGEISKNFIRKYYHLPYGLIDNTDQDWYVYRYSDVLLMLAEALNEQGQGASALQYLNPVRERAGLGDVNITDQTTLRDTIAHERRVELAFENHRWFDLVRTGQAISVLTPYGATQMATYSYLLPQSYQVTQNRLIYPIPFRENQVNPSGLPQNPGY